MSDFDPAKHPRDPAGTPVGGRFISFTHGSELEMKNRPLTVAEEELNDLRFDKVLKKWVKKNGEPVSDATAARLKAAGAKPGYAPIALNPDPSAPLQARGIDRKGDTQYMYSKEHSEVAAAEKFARLRDFNKALPGIRRDIAAAPGDSALVLSIIDATGIRIGSEKDTLHEAYGASTLLGQHIELGAGGKVSLNFSGKHGQTNIAEFSDARIHDALAAKKLGPNDRAFATTDSGVRRAMKSITGHADFSPKDFRTWTGTATALIEVAKYPMPKTKDEEQHLRTLVSKVVAAKLNNTPAVALKDYIDPAVWKRWGKKKP